MTAHVGIVGAGKLGTTLARLFVAAGYPTRVAGRSSAADLGMMLSILVPGAEASTSPSVMDSSDIVILALPAGRLPELPRPSERMLVVDATNYWRPTDGDVPAFIDGTSSHSENVRRLLGTARFVKAFNHLGYHDLDLRGSPRGAPDRVALAVAGDDASDRRIIADAIDRVGFDPVEIDTLAQGRLLESGHAVFGEPLTSADLEHAVRSTEPV